MPDTTKNGNIIKVSAAEQRLRDRETALQTVRDRLLACIPANLEETIQQTDALCKLDREAGAIEQQRIDARVRGVVHREEKRKANPSDSPIEKYGQRKARLTKERKALGESESDPMPAQGESETASLARVA